MTVDEREIGVVPATTEVGSLLVMGGECDPRGMHRCRAVVDEVDGHLFPVAFVVVHAVRTRAPVIEEEEEPVLQDDVAGAAYDAPVVRVVTVVRPVAVEQCSSCLGATRRAATGEERHASGGVDESSEYAHPAEAGLRSESRAIASALPREVVGPAESAVDQTEVVPGLVAVGELDESIHVEGALRCHEPFVGWPRSFPQLGDLDERLDRRREEVLAFVEPNDGFETSEQCQIISGRRLASRPIVGR